jgi:hypothetical protein
VYAIATGGGDAEHLRRSRRNQEQRDAQGREEDGDGEESRHTAIWQPLGLLTTVKPPALRERYDLPKANGAGYLTITAARDSQRPCALTYPQPTGTDNEGSSPYLTLERRISMTCHLVLFLSCCKICMPFCNRMHKFT